MAVDDWEAENGRFLAASLEWLRLVLRRRIEQAQATPLITPEAPGAPTVADPTVIDPAGAAGAAGAVETAGPVLMGPVVEPTVIEPAGVEPALPGGGRRGRRFGRTSAAPPVQPAPAAPAYGTRTPALPTADPPVADPPVADPPVADPPVADPPAADRSAAGLLGVAVTEQQIADAAEAVRQAEAGTPPPALRTLADRLGLSRFERDTLLLCVATELDPSIAELCAAAQGGRPYPTFALALATLADPAWEVVSPRQGLRFWRLVEVVQHAGQALVSSALRVDERIVNYVKGLNYLDDRLAPLTTRLAPAAGVPLPPSQRSVVEAITRHWGRSADTALVVQLVGADETGKQLVAASAAADADLVAYRLPVAVLPAEPRELDEIALLWARESVLLPLALYLDAADVDEEPAARLRVARFLARLPGPTAFAARESWPDLGRQSVPLDVAAPTPAERVALWRAALPAGDGGALDALAAQFALDAPAIRDVAELAGGDPDEAWRACLARTRPRLDALAQRLVPKVGWDDIVLAEPARSLLRQMADQVARRGTVYETWGFGDRITRGLGVSVLFAGASGTGKTMAAEVLAADLRLDLYRIDLSAVVSKYIGETEKNLRRLFDAAEAGGAILFFDEADALFGKRSEVKDAHDRYANIEINYLLQRMESYRGLAILTTNMRSALDNAFLRRLRFVVEFPFPGPAERAAIWRKSLPARAPVADLDFDRLARLQTNGGMTRNIALNAAFLAASADSPITMAHLLAAARNEFQKMELPVRDRDFAWEPAS
jgi:hypothetical protein